MKRVLVLGCGLVGGPIAVDLSKHENIHVTVMDKDTVALGRVHDRTHGAVETIKTDFEYCAVLSKICKEFDLVICAVPGQLGTSVLKSVIPSGTSIVDISFSPESPFDLEELALKHHVAVIVDCGVAPGLSNLLIGRALEDFGSLESATIYVGGLPVDRVFPMEYRAPFSPADVLEEYTRPVHKVVGGEHLSTSPLANVELRHFPGVGTLEAFETDGLRTLVKLPIPNMVEKTLRYPGHVKQLEFLKSLGFFGKDPVIDDSGSWIVPFELTAALLKKAWRVNPTDRDLTVMEVRVVAGDSSLKERVRTYRLLDYYDERTQTSSMARTTGYVATAVASYLLAGLPDLVGIVPLEFIGGHQVAYLYIMNYLVSRGIVVTEVNE